MQVNRDGKCPPSDDLAGVSRGFAAIKQPCALALPAIRRRAAALNQAGLLCDANSGTLTRACSNSVSRCSELCFVQTIAETLRKTGVKCCTAIRSPTAQSRQSTDKHGQARTKARTKARTNRLRVTLRVSEHWKASSAGYRWSPRSLSIAHVRGCGTQQPCRDVTLVMAHAPDVALPATRTIGSFWSKASGPGSA